MRDLPRYFDAPIRAVLSCVADLGFVVWVRPFGRGYIAMATREEDGERFVVRGREAYPVVCVLAEQVVLSLNQQRR